MNLDDLLKSIRGESDSKGARVNPGKFFQTKTFQNPLKGQRYTAPSLPHSVIKRQTAQTKPVAINIDADKLIPESNDASKELIEKINELIEVIKADNELERENQKDINKLLEDKRKKDREDRIESKKGIKSFVLDLKKSTGKFGGFFDKLKKFLKTVLLGGLINTLYNFLTNPKNKDKIAATQKFLKNYWPAVLGALAYFFTPFGTLVNFIVGTVGKFMKKLGLLVAKNPILAAALAGAAGAAASAMAVEERREKLDKEDDDSVVTPKEFLEENQTPGLPQLLDESIFQRGLGGGAGFGAFSSGGFAMGTDTVPAMLTPGEFVMSRGAVNMFGADTMMAMNKMGGGTNRPKYGKVLGYSGGGLFGEAPLTKAAIAAGYKDKELAAFLAQMSHETGNFQFRRELSGGASHYGGGGPYTLPDGKVVPAKYHGRGYVQLTHDYNYKKYGDRLGIDLLNNPELALDGDVAARIAVEYWKDHVRPTVKGDWDNVFLHSKAINLPSATSPSQVRGMTDRQKKYDEYLKKIMSQKPRQIMPAIPTAPGSLGPAFSDDTTMRKQQDISSNFASIKRKLFNPIETFIRTPLRRVFPVGTPNVPTETKNFVLPPVNTPKQNQSSSQTNDVPNFSVVSGNKMRDLISMDLGISDLAGVS